MMDEQTDDKQQTINDNDAIGYRIDDGEDWTQPDSGDWGLPCAIASFLDAWYSSDIDKAVGWAENIARRLFASGCWDERIDMDAMKQNIALIADECAKAIDAAGIRYDEMNDRDAYDKACCEIGRLVGKPIAPPDDTTIGEKHDTVAADAAKALRYYWLAKLHEKNGRFAPEPDYEQAERYARSIGIEPTDDNYVLQVIGLIPMP